MAMHHRAWGCPLLGPLPVLQQGPMLGPPGSERPTSLGRLRGCSVRSTTSQNSPLCCPFQQLHCPWVPVHLVTPDPHPLVSSQLPAQPHLIPLCPTSTSRNKLLVTSSLEKGARAPQNGDEVWGK